MGAAEQGRGEDLEAAEVLGNLQARAGGVEPERGEPEPGDLVLTEAGGESFTEFGADPLHASLGEGGDADAIDGAGIP